MTRDDLRWLGGTALAVIVVIGLTMVVVHAAGVMDGPDQAKGARLGAVLTFLAAMVTAVLSVIGLVAKRQADRHAAANASAEHERLQLADRHAAANAAAEHERLRLEAAMRAGSLFAGSANGSADHASVASGLLALTQLDRSDLAVALLVDLWRGEGQDRVSTETAILVLNAALSSNDANTQLVASELLCRNCKRLNACQSLHWPSVIDGRWRPEFGLKTKLQLVDALVTMTYTTVPSQNALRSVALRLYGIWTGDPSERVKGCIGRLIEAVVPTLERLGLNDFIQDPHPIALADLKTAAQSGLKNPDGFLESIVIDRRDKLAVWAADCRIVEMDPGSMGTAVDADGRCDVVDLAARSRTQGAA